MENNKIENLNLKQIIEEELEAREDYNDLSNKSEVIEEILPAINLYAEDLIRNNFDMLLQLAGQVLETEDGDDTQNFDDIKKQIQDYAETHDDADDLFDVLTEIEVSEGI